MIIWMKWNHETSGFSEEHVIKKNMQFKVVMHSLTGRQPRRKAIVFLKPQSFHCLSGYQIILQHGPEVVRKVERTSPVAPSTTLSLVGKEGKTASTVWYQGAQWLFQSVLLTLFIHRLKKWHLGTSVWKISESGLFTAGFWAFFDKWFNHMWPQHSVLAQCTVTDSSVQSDTEGACWFCWVANTTSDAHHPSWCFLAPIMNIEGLLPHHRLSAFGPRKEFWL